MATVTFDRDMNAEYKPTLAPYRGRTVEIRGANRGESLPAGQPVTIPDELAYAFAYDMAQLGVAISWSSSPTADALEEQRQTALAYAPDGPHAVKAYADPRLTP